MRIEKIQIYQVTLPFVSDFSHSLRKRFHVNNIIVEVVVDKYEIKGYGEGAPRSYVTGESQKSVSKSIHKFTQSDLFPWELENVGSANTFLFYGVFAAFGLIFIIKAVPETKNKSLEELEKELIKG